MTPRAHAYPRALLACILSAAPLWAQPGGAASPGATRPPPAEAAPGEATEVTVFTKDGGQLTGLLADLDSEKIILKIAGIRTTLEMSQVERYEILPPILQRYNQLRETIGDDPEQIVRLVQWLQAREQYTLALTEAQRALKLAPDNSEAKRLQHVLEQQILLKAKSPKSGPPTPAPAEEAVQEPRRAPVEVPLLSDSQINLIKVYEVDLADSPRLVIPRATVLRMLEANAGHPLVPTTREGREALLRKSEPEILDLMFKLQARDFYSSVQVLDQPAPMKQYRDQIARTWLMGCATNECHGGLEAGRLVLVNRNPNSDAAAYTNFFILQGFRIADAKGQVRGLIDWEFPERSPLLQMGLPREDSVFPHPPVPRGAAQKDIWKPEFRSTEDKLFQRAVGWIKAMYRPRPEYRLEYTPIRPFDPPVNPANRGGSKDPKEPVVR